MAYTSWDEPPIGPMYAKPLNSDIAGTAAVLIATEFRGVTVQVDSHMSQTNITTNADIG